MTIVSAVVIATAIETYGTLDVALGTTIAIFLVPGVLQII